MKRNCAAKKREPQLAAVAFQSHDHTSTALKKRQLQRGRRGVEGWGQGELAHL